MTTRLDSPTRAWSGRRLLALSIAVFVAYSVFWTMLLTGRCMAINSCDPLIIGRAVLVALAILPLAVGVVAARSDGRFVATLVVVAASAALGVGLALLLSGLLVTDGTLVWYWVVKEDVNPVVESLIVSVLAFAMGWFACRFLLATRAGLRRRMSR